MNAIFIEAIIGAVIAATLIFFYRDASKSGQQRMFAVWLVIAALIYIGFAFRGPSAKWLLIESAGLFIYLAFALISLKRSPMWLAAGWAAHVLWDVGLHWNTTAFMFVPHWYPPVCIGFDLVVAAYIAFRLAGVGKLKVIRAR